ncbi:MAG TPA: PEP-CTERM sorting domain-containing protein [Aliidongia sp.]|nr:PEP-CTERM sorting domain-containing protein [Aliidongia sp.]
MMRRFTYPSMALLLISTAPQALADVVGDFGSSVVDVDNSPNTNSGAAITLGSSGAIEQVVTANDGGMLAGIELFGVTGPINLGIVLDQGNAFGGDTPHFFSLSPSSGVAVSNGGFFFDASALGLGAIDPGADFLIYVDLPGDVELLGGAQASQGSAGFDDLFQCQGGTGFACVGGAIVDLTSGAGLDSLAFEACFVATGNNADDPLCSSGGGGSPPPPPPPPVPEPGTLSLLGAGLVMAELARRRFTKKPRR